ncbi:MAG: hypothetical protein Q4G35_03265 [Propionibacteriaceae bacterium]|nr:hypothetical protein [Propionibacteriaceae bacterium]
MIDTGETLVRVRPAKIVNARNDTEYDYDEATRYTIPGRRFVEPGASADEFGDRDLTSIELTVRIYGHPDIDRRDAIEIDGVRYRLEGKPLRHRSASRRLDHTVLALARWEGSPS